MAYPVKTQVPSPVAQDIAKDIRERIGKEIVQTNGTTSYRAGASIITEVIAALYKGPDGGNIISNNALADIVTACTDA